MQKFQYNWKKHQCSDFLRRLQYFCIQNGDKNSVADEWKFIISFAASVSSFISLLLAVGAGIYCRFYKNCNIMNDRPEVVGDDQEMQYLHMENASSTNDA